MILYLSGPMTGLPEYNYPAFHREADRLRQLGYTVINPAEIEHEHDRTWESYMRNDIKALMEAEAVAVLEGWYDSKGARIEVLLAKQLGMKVFEAKTMQEIF